MNRHLFFTLFCMSIFLVPSPVFANSDAEGLVEYKRSIFDEMYRRRALDINLVFNVEEVINNRKNDDEHPATLVFKNRRGSIQFWEVKVKIRGVFRRHNCSEMPPLKLNFKKSELKRRGFSKFDDYKLVTHCIADESLARALVIKEYLAYKYLNTLTKNSFRVQLLNINYIDSKTGEVTQHQGFMIEDFALLRDRIGAKKAETIYGTTKDKMPNLDRDHYQLVCMFQYMIGNTDWSLEAVRNIKLVEKNGKIIIIPYDFDFSGFVLAPYARVNADYDLKSLRQRAFMGFEKYEHPMKKAKKRLKKKRRKIMRITRWFYPLFTPYRHDALRFLDKFFLDIEHIKMARKAED